MPIRIRQATEADIPAIAAVGAAVFTPASDYITRAVYPAHLQPTGELNWDDYVAIRTQRKTAQFANEYTTILVAISDEVFPEGEDAGADTVSPDGERIVGFAVWTAPHPFGEESKRPDLPDFADKEVMKNLVTTLHEGAKRLFGESEGCDAWHLDFLGTDPRHRRRGVGKLLGQWGVDKAAADRRDCYLVATPVGKFVYAALGFKEVGVLELGGAPHTQMLIKNDPNRWK